MKNMKRFAGLLALSFVAISCAAANGDGEQPAADPSAAIIWSGETVVFTKAEGADPALEENQDRITDNVWITRGNGGGQIFNIAENSRAVKAISPAGTLWAVGTTDEIDSLQFAPFRTAVGQPKGVVGRNLVMFIEDEGIYIDVTFLSWSTNKAGGFSYERSTP